MEDDTGARRVYLRDGEELGSMRQTPVTQLMTEDCNNFLRFALLDEGIVNDNMLLPWQTKEICVAVCTSLASINDIETLEREFQTLRQCFDSRFQLSWL